MYFNGKASKLHHEPEAVLHENNVLKKLLRILNKGL